MTPKEIGPYRILDALGSGGAGTVFRAVDPRTGEAVALKLLATPSGDARSARRLAREFHALSELAHPNVVRVFDTGVHLGRPFLTMELVEGLTLRDYLSLSEEALSSTGSGSGRSISRDPGSDEEQTAPHAFTLAAFAEEPPSEDLGGAEPTDWAASLSRLPAPSPEVIRPLDPDFLEALNRPERVGRLKDALLQLCEALGYIHAHGLVHRDLKPTNVMVDEDRQVRLMDFGLAKFLADEADITAEGKLVGTYRYMSPEQILGEPLDARADLYSLGVILYELIAGKPPFDAPTPYALWQQVLETDPTPLLEVNEGGDDQLARIAQRLLRKEPDDRYQTAEEVSEALWE